jgi:glycosyltransferase involved in cell wall biosynthesis
MRILHVVAGLSPAGGGLSELVPRFAAEAARQGHAVTIATVAAPGATLSDAAVAAAAAGVRIVRHAASQPTALFFSWAMARAMTALVVEADVVHVHSQWTFPVWCAARAALVAGVPLVMSPQGAFDPVRLAHSAWKKAAVAGIDRALVQRATVVHAASAAEERWIRAFASGRGGTGRVPAVRRIPMGVDLPDAVPRAARPADRPRTVLALGRLHPLKGLDLLVAAWGELARTDAAAGWNLVIAGPDEQGTRARLEEAIREQPIPRVTLAGPVHGDAKRRILAEADLFVLPSRSENFGLVVPEALAAGLPVIATRGTPWSEIDGVCGWWVEVGVSPLAAALAEAIGCPDAKRVALGERGRELVERTYRWDVVGREMTGLYEVVIGPARH